MGDHLFAMHRRDQLEDFDSTVVGTRTTAGVWNATTKVYDPTVTPFYTGGARLRSQGTNAVVVQAGDQPFTLRTYDIQTPSGTEWRIDDYIEVTASADPLAVGLKLRVIDVPKTEWLSVRNLVAVEET